MENKESAETQILVDNVEYQQLLDKAKKWDQLSDEIESCYFDEDGNEVEDDSIDLITIGELAATAFGWLG